MLTNNSIKYHFTPQAGVRICIDFYDHSKPIECECAILPKRSICKCWSRSLYKDLVSLHNKGRIATVAKIKERKSSQEGEGNYHPSFVSNRGSIVWHLNSMRSEDGNFPFCECRLRIQDNWHWARICMHLKFIDIDRLDYCLLIFNLFFFDFLPWQLAFANCGFLKCSTPSKCHPSFWWVFCILRNVCVCLFTCCASSMQSHTDLGNWIFYPDWEIAGKLLHALWQGICIASTYRWLSVSDIWYLIA